MKKSTLIFKTKIDPTFYAMGGIGLFLLIMLLIFMGLSGNNLDLQLFSYLLATFFLVFTGIGSLTIVIYRINESYIEVCYPIRILLRNFKYRQEDVTHVFMFIYNRRIGYSRFLIRYQRGNKIKIQKHTLDIGLSQSYNLYKNLKKQNINVYKFNQALPYGWRKFIADYIT